MGVDKRQHLIPILRRHFMLGGVLVISNIVLDGMIGRCLPKATTTFPLTVSAMANKIRNHGLWNESRPDGQILRDDLRRLASYQIATRAVQQMRALR